MRYKDDPRQIALRYPSYCEKCQIRLSPGTVVYYWPRTRTLLCSDCGEPEFRSFLSAAADEEAYAGKGNPFSIEPQGRSAPFLFVFLVFQENLFLGCLFTQIFVKVILLPGAIKGFRFYRNPSDAFSFSLSRSHIPPNRKTDKHPALVDIQYCILRVNDLLCDNDMGTNMKLLVQKLQKGDENTFISLFKEYYVCLCSYSRRYVGRKDVAEEIVSETFFKIWENRTKIEIHSSVKSYLFQAVANNSLLHLRKLRKEERIEDYFTGTEGENIGFFEIAENRSDQSLLVQELTRRIEDALNQLPPQQQMAFRLKRFEGKKNKEIADEMGLAVKTVEMHLSKAMTSMRSNLKDYLPAFLLFLLLK